MDTTRIRNFSIVARVNHGTSTPADRDVRERLLDSMGVRRRRGITIRARAARPDGTARAGRPPAAAHAAPPPRPA